MNRRPKMVHLKRMILTTEIPRLYIAERLEISERKLNHMLDGRTVMSPEIKGRVLQIIQDWRARTWEKSQ